MSPEPVAPASNPDVGSPKSAVLGAAAVLVLATFAAYSNTFQAPFQFDDLPCILDNPSITRLWPLSVPLSPPSGWGLTVEGRPLVNLSLAINYALGGLAVPGYHLFNVAVQALAGLALFGVIRRTLLLPRLRERFGGVALPAALAGALFWTLHPLQTESVTYVVQRAESLAGLFFLSTLYCFLRAVAAPCAAGWGGLAVAATVLGMACKEVMVAAPLLVFLHDRTFAAGSFPEAWKQRWRLHVSLLLTWLFLGWLVLHAGSRGGTFDLANPHAWWRYGLTQFVAVTDYLRLTVWPHPLIFDRGMFWVAGVAKIWPQILLTFAVFAATLAALVRWPAYGFLGGCFFATLAPSSALPGTIQMVVEHRMYLPLLAAAGLVTHLVAMLAPRCRRFALVVLALGLGGVTHARNADYRSVLALWTDTVANRPTNARAMANLGSALFNAGRNDEAVLCLRESLRLDATNPDAHYNFGLALRKAGVPMDAEREFAEAARLKPQLAAAHYLRALELVELGRRAESIPPLERAVQLRPDLAEAQCNLGLLLDESGRSEAARAHCEAALRWRPDYAEAESALGAALLHLGQTASAFEHLQRATRLKPDLAAAHFNLGLALAAEGRSNAATGEYAAAVRCDPRHAEARLNFGIALAQSGNLAGALPQLEEAVRLRPDLPEAQQNLGIVLAQVGRADEAVGHYDEALRLRPAYPEAHYNLGNALLALGRLAEARAHFTRALEFNPHFDAAREMLERLQAAAGTPR